MSGFDMDWNAMEGNHDQFNSVGQDERNEESSITESTGIEEDGNVAPMVGMEFESPIAAQLYYNNYAKKCGFGIKIKSSNYVRRSKILRRMVFSCTKEGYKQKNENVKNPRPDTREGCKAMMGINKKTDSEKWIVTKVITEHTHVLNPAKAQFHLSHRNTVRAEKKRLLLHQVAGGEMDVQMSAFFKADERLRRIRLRKKDRRKNSNDHGRQLVLQEGDMQALLNFFNHMQIKNPSFFYAMDIGDDARLRNIFWVDAKARASYNYFHDVIMFDSTHLTNKYDIPFASFVGMNHHGHHILLGCGLLADETKETYGWLFETWLQAMSNRPPISIITDQCEPIQAAVAEVLPEVRHRLCLSHILERLPEKLGPLGRDEMFLKRLRDCINGPLTVEEFERNWLEIVKDYQLFANEWLNMLYEDRGHWVPVYLKDIFFAGMSTIHRSEGVNAFFDSFVHPKTNLEEFVEQYELAIQGQCDKEAEADYCSFHTTPIMKTKSFFEKDAANIYTREIFFKFQDEICGMPNCSTRLVQQDGAIAKHSVIEIGEDDNGIRKVKEYEVKFDASETRVYCVCHSFEFQGFLCKHALVVLFNSGINEIPSHYILSRWRKNAKHSHGLDGDGLEDCRHWMDRFDDLCHRTNKFSHDGALNAGTYTVALDALDEAMKKVHQADGSLRDVAEPTNESVDRFAFHSITTSLGVTEPSIESIDKGIDHDQSVGERNETNDNGILPAHKEEGVPEPIDFNLQQNNP